MGICVQPLEGNPQLNYTSWQTLQHHTWCLLYVVPNSKGRGHGLGDSEGTSGIYELTIYEIISTIFLSILHIFRK
jgi:hypothetical protein